MGRMKLTKIERKLIMLGLTVLKRDYENDYERCNDEEIKELIKKTIERIENLEEKVKEDDD